MKNNNNNKILLPSNLLDSSDYEILSKNELNKISDQFGSKLKLPYKMRGGYLSYNILLIIEDVFSDKYNVLVKYLNEMFLGLEDNNVYSLLFTVFDGENDIGFSVRSSLLVTKNSSVEILTKILIQDLIKKEFKYGVYSSYTLIIQGRI